MDCALVVDPAVAERGESGGVSPDRGSARVVPMHRVRAGDLVVVGWKGVRVETPAREADAQGFGFMTSEVSSEKPKALSVDARGGQLETSEGRARGGWRPAPGEGPRSLRPCCRPHGRSARSRQDGQRRVGGPAIRGQRLRHP